MYRSTKELVNPGREDRGDEADSAALAAWGVSAVGLVPSAAVVRVIRVCHGATAVPWYFLWVIGNPATMLGLASGCAAGLAARGAIG
jgi:hypothetical protein